jgi:hypothetical protein
MVKILGLRSRFIFLSRQIISRQHWDQGMSAKVNSPKTTTLGGNSISNSFFGGEGRAVGVLGIEPQGFINAKPVLSHSSTSSAQ